MSFNWELLRPNQDLNEAHQALVREIGETFLKTGEGIPDHQKRVQLGKARNRLNELQQLGLIRNMWNRYFPTFPGVYYLSPILRENYAAILHLLFTAIKALYESQPKAFAIQEIEARANSLLSSSTWTEWARTLKGEDVHLQRAMFFFHDFPQLVSIQQSTPGNPVGALIATEHILDYEDLQQAWDEEIKTKPYLQPKQSLSAQPGQPKDEPGFDPAQMKADLNDVASVPSSTAPETSVPLEKQVKQRFETAVAPKSQEKEEQPADSIQISSISDIPTERDSLGFKPYVEAISRFLLSPDTRPPLTLSIEGEWGSGKSSFMLQLRKSIVGDPWWKRIKKAWSGAEAIDPTDSRASKPSRLWQAIERKRRFAVQFNPWRHDKENSLWAAFALEFLRQTKGQRFLLRRWWGSAKLFKAHYKWKKGWFEPLRALAVWLAIAILVAAFVEVLIQDPWWAAQVAIALLNKPNSSAGKIDVLNILLAFGGNAAFAAIILTIWLKAKDILGNPLEINLKKYLRSPDYEGRVAFVEQFHADFKKIVDAYAGQEKVFVFIDDLDRCEVPKAAELMKAINLLISDDPRLIFILGMDRDKVAAGIAVKYDTIFPYLLPESLGASNEPQARWRAGLDFGQNFLQKFIQLPFRVPDPNPEQYDDFIRTISVPTRTKPPTKASPIKESPATAELPATSKPTTETKRTETKVHTPPPPAPSPAEVQVRRERELLFGGDSDKVRAVASMFANTLGRNPRRMIQFLNLFRLQAYIANEIGLFDANPRQNLSALTLEQLGKFVAIALRWPALLAHFAEEPKLLERLEGFATNNALSDPSPTERESRWLSERQLRALLNFEIQERTEGWFLFSDYTMVSPTIYKLLHICPQRVRLPQAPPTAEPSPAPAA